MTMWQSLNLPALALDLAIIIWLLADLPDFPRFNLSKFKYDFSGQLIGLMLACTLYFSYGFILGLHVASWQLRRPKIQGRKQRFMDSDLAAFFLSPMGLYYLPFQVLGILLFLPFYFDMLPISGIASALLSIPFGIFLAIEMEHRRCGKENQQGVALDNFPEFASAYAFLFLLIFPIEISYRPSSQNGADVVFWGLLGVLLSYGVFRLIRRFLYSLRDLFRDRLTPAIWTPVSAHIIHFGTMFGFAFIETLLYGDMQTRGYSNLKIKLLFSLFGLIPLRLLDLFSPPRNYINVTVAAIAFLLFILIG